MLDLDFLKKPPAKWTRPLAAVALLLCFLPGCGGRYQEAIIIAGSTSVQPYAEVLAEEYAVAFPERAVDIQGGGSSAGITAAESGAADIGMSSRDLTVSEQRFWSVEIAKDGLALIVHPDNPVEGLTLEQIRDVYTGRVTDWSELGGNAARIHIIAREEGSGTRGAFEGLVMGGEKISPKAIVQDSNGAVRQLVSGDRSAVGFISLGLVDHTVDALWLDGVEPTAANVLSGSYSLYRPFLFVAEGPPAGLSKEFIDFTLSPQGQRLMADEGLITNMTGGAGG